MKSTNITPKLRAVKTLIKKQNEWKNYCKRFKKRKIRLIFSYIVFVFDFKVDLTRLAMLEIELIKADQNKHMFEVPFLFLQKYYMKNVKWDELAIFLWYIFQALTYYKDTRRNINNVFSKENYIEVNAIKRQHYYAWLHSLPLTLPHYNAKIIMLLKRVS